MAVAIGHPSAMMVMPDQTFWIRAILAIICLSTAVILFLHVRRINSRCWQVAVDGNGRFHCQLPKPERFLSHFHGELDNKTVIWPSALFLILRRLDNDNMINLVVLSDALDDEDFRRLSIACRWKMTHSTPKAVPDL